MKTIFLRCAAILLLLAGSFYSCAEKREIQSQIYYVVGFDGNIRVDSKTGTLKSGGYLFISENLKDSLLVDNRFWVEGETTAHYGNLLDGIISFPEDAFRWGRCGYDLFPDEYRYAFMVRIDSYRLMTEKEARDAIRIVTSDCVPRLDSREYFNFKKIVITSISKIQ